MPNIIKCPKCHHEFDVEDVLAADIEKKLSETYEQKLKESLSGLEADQIKLQEERRQFEEKKKQENEMFLQRIEAEKKKMTAVLEDQLNQKISGDFALKLEALEKNKTEAEEKLKAARDQERNYLQKMQELETQKAEAEIQAQRKLQEEKVMISEQIRKQEAEKTQIEKQEFEFKLRELEKQLQDQKKLAEEMKRKAEQGSMQLQGEVQELALEALLKQQFPFDQIEEVGKGVKGADCIQLVRNPLGQVCGKIIFESKRTQDFAADWIDKLKKDMLGQGADVAVIVTRALPKDMAMFGEKNGVYVCNFHEVKSMVSLLRQGILKVADVRKSQENKGEKMAGLYDYLTGAEFMGNWNAIREGFRSLRAQLQKEREDVEKNFKKKEKLIEQIIHNSLYISGSIEGIAGQDMVNLQLEAGESTDDTESMQG